jgi:hypothetical protein
VVAPPGTVAALLRVLADEPGLTAVFGSYDDAPGHPTLVAQFRDLLHHYVHQHGAPEAETFWAGCGAVRRQAFERVGGFDPARRIEDVDLGRRMRAAGMRIRLDRGIRVKHLKAWTLATMVRTDVLRRGIPWCLLLLEGGGRRELGTLNLTGGGFASAALAWTAVVAAAAAPGGWRIAGTLLALGALVAVNLPFYRFLGRLRGGRFALACIPLHALHHLCNGVSAGAALAIWLVRRPLAWLPRSGVAQAARTG